MVAGETSKQGTAVDRLSDAPDWLYLLQAFDTVYRLGSDGGSKLIRGHKERVREALADIIRADPPLLKREASTKPVTAHLPRALDLGRGGALADMSGVLSRCENQLTWEYGYAHVPPALARNYAYCEILGPQGPIQSDRLILGFVLFAPGTVYPEHNTRGSKRATCPLPGPGRKTTVRSMRRDLWSTIPRLRTSHHHRRPRPLPSRLCLDRSCRKTGPADDGVFLSETRRMMP